MFEVKTRARYLTHKTKLKGTLLLFLPLGASAGFIISALLFVMCCFYPVPAVFEDLKKYNSTGLFTAVKIFLFVSAVLFLLFYFSLRFTLRAYFFYRTDKNQSRPKSFISFRTGARLMYKAAFILLHKTAAAAVFLFPGLISLAVLYLLLKKSGVPPAVFYTGLSFAALQLLAGAAAWFVFSGRYYMTDYLLYLNPMMSVYDAALSSAGFMRGKLFSTALFRLGTLPWTALQASVAAFPFSFAYVSLMKAVLCEKIFAEDKTRVNSPAVTFFIGRKSIFIENNQI